ncbi:UNVERIFIED_CONTAM: hypothetical protein K2H54_032524 [Gekko kuhli]
MGQAKSRRRDGTTPHPTPSGPGTGSGLDLSLLPQELLVLILSWVPGRDLVTRGRLVCRQWRDLIDGPTLWKLRGGRDPSQREALEAAMEAARRCPRMEWARVGILQPFGRNLVRNPRGEGSCRRTLLVDLVKEGLWEDLLDTLQPDIFVSEWWGTDGKRRRALDLYVVLLAADKKSVISRFVTRVDPAEEWDVPFQQASHVFQKYGPGARYLQFKSNGICPGPEHVKAHITNCNVLVKLSG